MKVSSKIMSKKLNSEQMRNVKGGQLSPSTSIGAGSCSVNYTFSGSDIEFSDMINQMVNNPQTNAQAQRLIQLYNAGCITTSDGNSNTPTITYG